LYKTSKRFVNRVAELALSKKAENVVSMDLRGLTTTCDFFVICEGTSEAQVRAIADAIVEGMKESGERPWHVEGYEARKWVLIDYVNVVIHVFDTETRDYYQLERLWGDAKFEEYKDEE
jgi:ribosome-associated protein